MANISTYISQIMSAVYGEEVRGSIRDALNAMNADNNAILRRSIDGIFPERSVALSRYSICRTAASEGTKSITSGNHCNIDSPNGMIMLVKFANGNTADPSTLRMDLNVRGIESALSAPIRYHGAFLPSADLIQEDGIYIFVFTTDSVGESGYWELVGDLNGAIDIPDAFTSFRINDSRGLPDRGYTATGTNGVFPALQPGDGVAFESDSSKVIISAKAASMLIDGVTRVPADSDNEIKLFGLYGVRLQAEPSLNTIGISLVEDEIDSKDFTPADLGFEIFDDQGIRRQYVSVTSGGSYYRVKLEAKTGFMTILIKNLQDYDISEYDFTLDYGNGSDGDIMNQLLTVAGITTNSISSTAYFAGDHYEVASNGSHEYSEINLNFDPSTQPKALLVSFYKNGASADEVLINGTIKINFKKFVVKKFKELQQQIRLLASDPSVEEIIEGGSENG